MALVDVAGSIRHGIYDTRGGSLTDSGIHDVLSIAAQLEPYYPRDVHSLIIHSGQLPRVVETAQLVAKYLNIEQVHLPILHVEGERHASIKKIVTQIESLIEGISSVLIVGQMYVLESIPYKLKGIDGYTGLSYAEAFVIDANNTVNLFQPEK